MMGTCGEQRVLRCGGAALRAVRARTRSDLRYAGASECRRTDADPDAGLVHHVEHVSEPVVRLADEVADGTSPGRRTVYTLAEVEQAS